MKNTNNTLAAVQLSQVIEQLEQHATSDLIEIYNEYANHNGYEQVFDNDEQTINDLFLTPYDAIIQTNNKDYKDHEDYFTFNGYGHAVSFDYRLSENSPIDIDELAEWLISEDKLADYDITVTTIDDIIASIEDNITDNEELTFKLADYINEDYDEDDVASDIAQWCIVTLYDYDYDQLIYVINHLGINYQ